MPLIFLTDIQIFQPVNVSATAPQMSKTDIGVLKKNKQEQVLFLCPFLQVVFCLLQCLVITVMVMPESCDQTACLLFLIQILHKLNI